MKVERERGEKMETVQGLALAVSRGEIEAAVAGARMRPLLSVRKPRVTQAERKEGYNELAYEVDQNSFVHVSALFSLGVLSAQQYAAIREALK
jgi:hypothetical protein